MSDPNDHFVLLQARIITRLTAVDPLVPAPVPANGKPVPFLSEQKGNTATKLLETLNALGLGAVVLTPTALLIDPASPSLVMHGLVLVQIQENTIMNQGALGTKIPALRMAAFVMKRLQGWSHQLYVGDESAQRLLLSPKPFVLIRDDPPLTYNVAATAMMDLGAPLT